MLLRHIPRRARFEIFILAAGTTDWTVVAIVVPIAVASIAACVALITARLNRQSKEHEMMTALISVSREQMVRAEASAEDVKRSNDHNIPEIFERLRKLENWQAGTIVRCDKCEAEQGEKGST